MKAESPTGLIHLLRSPYRTECGKPVGLSWREDGLRGVSCRTCQAVMHKGWKHVPQDHGQLVFAVT